MRSEARRVPVPEGARAAVAGEPAAQRRRPGRVRGTRRRFLADASAGALALGLSPASRALGANERLHVAVIGTGGMGSGHVRELLGLSGPENVRLTAVCDVFRERRETNAELAGCVAHRDYREVLARGDVDAVVIATPDHWHARMTLDALAAGKHVYCQKPMTRTIPEAIAVRDAARRSNLALQIGAQRTSDDRFWKAREAVADGRVGKVVWSQASYCRNSRDGEFNWRMDLSAGPHAAGAKHIDWDLWLGHELGLAPKIPWDPEHFFRFRKFWAYSGGVATDLLYHVLAPLLLVTAGRSGEYPLRAVAGGGIYVQKDSREIPDAYFTLIDYPSEHTVSLTSVMTNTDGPPLRLFGNEATVSFDDGVVLTPQKAWEDEFARKNGTREAREIETSPRRDHMENFLDAIRDGAALHCDHELGAATMVGIGMGVAAYRERRTVTWDADREVVR